ncbi:hypothetical protein ACO22_03093 [Paracoccidioides brasiliensis]|uniref:Uncharacterized protein n=1 Tax=Paracoccidioides brasiliensis TaxID=121759 RepID=A0A1D2JGY5_PARBR|nr:hypothetical protein ACO22_03093 [Paracoccidioides brasiliensis]
MCTTKSNQGISVGRMANAVEWHIQGGSARDSAYLPRMETSTDSFSWVFGSITRPSTAANTRLPAVNSSFTLPSLTPYITANRRSDSFQWMAKERTPEVHHLELARQGGVEGIARVIGTAPSPAGKSTSRKRRFPEKEAQLSKQSRFIGQLSRDDPEDELVFSVQSVHQPSIFDKNGDNSLR